MGKFTALALGLTLAAVAGSAPQDAGSSGHVATRTLKVKVHYTGSGTVDDQHKIYLALWDSPDFATSRSAIPIAVQAASSKDQTVTFDAVSASPVYVSAAFDPSGQWNAQSAPPSGSSLAMYSKAPPKPGAIEIRPGDTATVDLSFDDRVKVP